jgi:hypothetical protein
MMNEEDIKEGFDQIWLSMTKLVQGMEIIYKNHMLLVEALKEAEILDYYTKDYPDKNEEQDPPFGNFGQEGDGYDKGQLN